MNFNKISIIINNYNYKLYLRDALESVINQSIAPYEIILVDDGSSDGSLEVAREYKDKITIIEQENSGQASAINAGYMVATGDWMWFLDADDMLQQNAIEMVLPLLNPDIAKIHGKLTIIDKSGNTKNTNYPSESLSSLDVVDTIRTKGNYIWPPTSGNIFSKRALTSIMPIPEDTYRICADLYLCYKIAFLGNITTAHNPLGFYRLHDENNFSGSKISKKQLRNQAMNIYATIGLYEDAFDNQKYPLTKWNIETLLVAKRFADYTPLKNISYGVLFTKYKVSLQSSKYSTVKKILSLALWFFYRFMPLSLINKIKTH